MSGRLSNGRSVYAAAWRNNFSGVANEESATSAAFCNRAVRLGKSAVESVHRPEWAGSQHQPARACASRAPEPGPARHGQSRGLGKWARCYVSSDKCGRMTLWNISVHWLFPDISNALYWCPIVKHFRPTSHTCAGDVQMCKHNLYPHLSGPLLGHARNVQEKSWRRRRTGSGLVVGCHMARRELPQSRNLGKEFCRAGLLVTFAYSLS